MSETVPPEIEALLTSEPLVAYLGTCYEGRPRVAPVWYRYEDGGIEILTTGQKLANIRRNPRVALAVQKDQAGIPEWMVTVRGHATVIRDDERQSEQNSKLNRKYGVDEDAWDENSLVRIEIGSVTHREY